MSPLRTPGSPNRYSIAASISTFRRGNTVEIGKITSKKIKNEDIINTARDIFGVKMFEDYNPTRRTWSFIPTINTKSINIARNLATSETGGLS